MFEGHYNIKIFSDTTDLVSVTSALKQLELKGFPLNVSFPSELEVDNNDIVVLRIESLDSNLYKSIIRIRRGKTNKFIIIINNSDALLVTSLLKQGFYDMRQADMGAFFMNLPLLFVFMVPSTAMRLRVPASSGWQWMSPGLPIVRPSSIAR